MVSLIKRVSRCTRAIISRTVIEREAFNKQKTIFTRKLDFNFMEKLMKYCIWSIALRGSKTWTHRIIDLKYTDRNVVPGKNGDQLDG